LDSPLGISYGEAKKDPVPLCFQKNREEIREREQESKKSVGYSVLVRVKAGFPDCEFPEVSTAFEEPQRVMGF
jgi:hypothetical protein